MSQLTRSPSGRVVMLLDNHFAPDRRVLREVQLLGERNVDVTIIAWDRRAAPGHEIPSLPPGIHLERVNVPAPPGGGLRTFAVLARFAIRVWRKHKSLLRSSDLLIVHDLYLLPLGVALSRRWRIPLAYDAHEDFVLMEQGRLPDGVLRIVRAVETALARHAVFVVVPGRVRRRRWIDAGLRPPVVLANTGVAASKVDYSGADGDTAWDLAYCGLLDTTRRLDLLISLAQLRPDLHIAIAGDGRAAKDVDEAAATLQNLDFLGWTDDPDAVLKRSRAVYYGLDPNNAYADAACPNNLYQAIRARRPLIYFCGGEVAELAAKFRIGLRVAPQSEALAAALDAADAQDWEFDAALQAIEAADSGREYVNAVDATLQRRNPGRTIFDVPSVTRARRP